MRLGQSELRKILTALYTLFILPVSKSRIKWRLYMMDLNILILSELLQPIETTFK